MRQNMLAHPEKQDGISPLFIPQRLHRIDHCRFACGEEAGEQADDRKNARGQEHNRLRENRLAEKLHRAVVGREEAHAADERNEQRFENKLRQNGFSERVVVEVRNRIKPSSLFPAQRFVWNRDLASKNWQR